MSKKDTAFLIIAISPIAFFMINPLLGITALAVAMVAGGVQSVI